MNWWGMFLLLIGGIIVIATTALAAFEKMLWRREKRDGRR